MKIDKDYPGFSLVEIIFSIFIIIGLALTGYLVYKDQHHLALKVTTPKVSVAASSQQSNNNLSWIIQEHFLSLVTANPGALNVFKNASKVYLVLSSKQAQQGSSLEQPFNAVPTVYYNSYAKFVADYNNHLINSSVKAVLFDDSSDTPASVVPTVEANNPYQYDQLITEFAHQHHMISMCDFILGKRLGNKSGEAPPCDIALLNYSQQSERNASDYSKVVDQAVTTIRQAYPNMPILVGLSTNPRGPTITANELVDAINATKEQVNGYWISIPTSGGVGCPNCAKQNPALLPEFLDNLN